MKRKQSGITMIGFVIVLGLVGVGIYLGMKLVPMYMEYYAVKQALSSMSEEQGIADNSPVKISDLFFRRLYVSYSENVKPSDVKIKRIDRGWQVDVNYEVRKPMIANLDVIGKFSATKELTKHGVGE